jgi:hypothetical protein
MFVSSMKWGSFFYLKIEILLIEEENTRKKELTHRGGGSSLPNRHGLTRIHWRKNMWSKHR